MRIKAIVETAIYVDDLQAAETRRRHHDGKLDFGPWEQTFCGEFGGNRPKRVR
jgi:hypothetical protein